MKKGIKIFLLIIIPILMVGIVFGSTLLFSYKQFRYSIDETSLTFDIQFDIIDEYIGFIKTATPIELTNNGLYNIKNLNITISVYGSNFSISSLNGILLSKGTNFIGDLNKKTQWSGELVTNITYYIAFLAIQDGDFEIIIDLNFKLDFLLFDYFYSTQFVQIKQWDSPFGF